ncbi:glycosyltransferase family 4 protein [Pontiellaceae bacterium B1224]|nr:glycosyltransferase family 4 protein [Pontiellaceae bacterium B1224]
MNFLDIDGRPQRVAVITPRFTSIGGGERYCVETCKFAARHPGIDLTVICEECLEPDEHITFIEVGRSEFPRSLKKRRFAAKVSRILQDSNFDLIHSHQQVPGAHICSLHGTPHQIWVESVKKRTRPSAFDRSIIRLEQQMLQHADCSAVIPVSTLVRESYEQVYDFSNKIEALAAPGVDPGWLATAQSETNTREEVRNRLNIQATDFVIGFVSMNWPHKGLDLLIDALHGLPVDARKETVLMVVGKGDETAYAKKADKAGVRIRFTGIVGKEIPDFYAAMDLFALPSNWDAFAMVVTEAMAAGKSVLISDQTGARDIVTPAENGYVLPLKDAKIWSDHIQMLKSDRQRCRLLGAAARETAMQCSWVACGESIVGVYQKVLLKKSEQKRLQENA